METQDVIFASVYGSYGNSVWEEILGSNTCDDVSKGELS